MINRRKLEKFDREIEECFREHGKANSLLQSKMAEVAQLALSGKEITDDIKESIDGAKWTIDFYANRLEELKENMKNLIGNISLPSY